MGVKPLEKTAIEFPISIRGRNIVFLWRISHLLAGIALVAASEQMLLFAQPPSSNATPAQNQSSPQQLPDAPPVHTAPSARTPGETAAAPSVPAPQWSSSSGTASRFWSSNDPNAQVTVLENTMIRVMNNEPLSTRATPKDARLSFTLSEDVVVDGVLIIPRGALFHGTVIESRQAGTLTGKPDLILQLTSLDLAGRTYPLYTYRLKVIGASKTKPTLTQVRDGAIVGAAIGGIEASAGGKLSSVGTGAAIGGGVGVTVAAASPSPVVAIPAESQMDFYLAMPISVVPATAEETARLSQGLHLGGPVLYVRGETP